jgi:hypothetical protein
LLVLETGKEPFQMHPCHLRHILSVDVEDYFQVEAFADRIPRSTWDKYPCRVIANTERILDLLDQY